MNRRSVCCLVAAAVVCDALASFGPLSPSAVPYERTPIWPEGKMPDVQAHQIAAKTAERSSPNFRAEDFRRPYIEWYAPNPATGRVDLCVLFISGGGFSCCCDAARMQPAIDRFVQAGITVASLTYRTPRPVGLPIHQSGWEDAQRAVRVIRSQAAKRGFSPEKIGATGISAGSKLLLLLATSSETRAYRPVDAIDELPCNLLFALPQAPAYVLTDSDGGPNARQGDAPDVRLVPELRFDAKTCPMCFFQGGLDEYSPNGSTQIYRQLRRMKIPAELHFFAGRGHGFHGDLNRGDGGTGCDHWFGRAMEFIRQMNYDGRRGAEVALMERFNSDGDRASCEREDVWPEGKMPDVQTNQCRPYLEWHLPETLRTRAIQIIYSGGSYMGNSPDGFEVAPARRYLNAKGMTVVTLKYRTPRPLNGLAKHTTAWQDLQRTVRIVRHEAKRRGLDPDRIGIMGSSAGGHLTLMGATSSRHWSYAPIDELDRISCAVQWAVAVYPAYALTDGVDRGNATGGNADDARPVREFSFDLDTCPILFLHGDADGWAAMNSVKCWEQLRRMGVQCDLHTLATRGHCFQRAAAPGTGSYTWLDRIWEFLNERGVAPKLAEKIAARCPVLRTDDWHGFPRTVFRFKGREAWVVEPKGAPRRGNPWTWTIQWWDAFVPRTAVPRMLASGYHHAVIDGFAFRGSDEGMRLFADFQAFLVGELGLAPKTRLIGMSWGGFFSTRYAAAYPQNVAKIFLDCPLLNFAGFPAPDPWRAAGVADADWSGDPRMPVNLAEPIAKAKIPILLRYGGQDGTVLPKNNCELFIPRFKAAGGDIRVIRDGAFGHHPHGFEADSAILPEFFN